MLLIGGKNLVPLFSATIIQSLGWRWVFIIVGIIVAVMFVLTFLFVHETYWDRSKRRSNGPYREFRGSLSRTSNERKGFHSSPSVSGKTESLENEEIPTSPNAHVRFGPTLERPALATVGPGPDKVRRSKSELILPSAHVHNRSEVFSAGSPAAPDLATTVNSPYSNSGSLPRIRSPRSLGRLENREYAFDARVLDAKPLPSDASQQFMKSTTEEEIAAQQIEYVFRKKTYREILAIFQGRLSQEKWRKAALRPFILFCYPAIAFVSPLAKGSNQ